MTADPVVVSRRSDRNTRCGACRPSPVVQHFTYDRAHRCCDYTTYDISTASALATWSTVLLLSGAIAIVGTVVIAGVSSELRNMTTG